VLHGGKSHAFCEAEARDDAGALLAKAIGTFKLLSDRRGRRLAVGALPAARASGRAPKSVFLGRPRARRRQRKHDRHSEATQTVAPEVAAVLAHREGLPAHDAPCTARHRTDEAACASGSRRGENGTRPASRRSPGSSGVFRLSSDVPRPADGQTIEAGSPE